MKVWVRLESRCAGVSVMAWAAASVVAPGVIRYEFKAWGLCASVSGALYTTTTEVYPDSPRATPEQCIAAQVAAVCAGVEFVCAQAR